MHRMCHLMAHNAGTLFAFVYTFGMDYRILCLDFGFNIYIYIYIYIYIHFYILSYNLMQFHGSPIFIVKDRNLNTHINIHMNTQFPNEMRRRSQTAPQGAKVSDTCVTRALGK